MTVNGINYNQIVNSNGKRISSDKKQNLYQTSSLNTGRSNNSDEIKLSSARKGSKYDANDGKISIFSKCRNMAKGIGKTVKNAVKGMFTDKNGKFSIAKTLLSLGTAAICVAFPAVGLVACGIGAIAGGSQIIKGAIAASKAKSDFAAEQAWQNIGSGAFTLGVSIMGAKASYGAVEATAAKSTAGSAMQELAKNGSSSILDKGIALGKDMVSSTKYQAGEILGGVKNSSLVNTTKDVRKIGKMEKAKAKALRKMESGKTLSSAEEKAILEWENIGEKGFSNKALSRYSKINTTKYHVSELSKALKGKDFAAAKSVLNDMAENGDIQSLIQEIPTIAKESVHNIIAIIKEEGIEAAVKKFGYESVSEAVKVAGAQLVNDKVNNTVENIAGKNFIG